MKIGLCQRCKRIHFVGEKELCPECMDKKEEREDEESTGSTTMFVEEKVSKERYVMIPSLLNKAMADRIMQNMGLEHGYDREERGYYWYKVFGGDRR